MPRCLEAEKAPQKKAPCLTARRDQLISFFGGCTTVKDPKRKEPNRKEPKRSSDPWAELDEPDEPVSVERPKSFFEKAAQMKHAPRDLWILFSIKLAESTAYFAFSYIYAPYLSDEFGFTDIEAGFLYGMYGVLCSVFGLFSGPVIDALDLRSALLLGTIPSFIARLGSALTTDSRFMSLCSFSLLPIGASFGLPVFALGVRRYTHPENRAFSFTLFYTFLCASCAVGGLLISMVRPYCIDGCYVPILNRHLSWMRVTVLWSAALTLYCVAASCCVRNSHVQQDPPIEEAKVEPHVVRWAGLRATFRVVYRSSRFWKLLVLSLCVAIGARATFRHLDATFPKYFMRMYGKQAPFELFLAMEPVATVILSFPITYILLNRRISTYTALVIGTFLQSCCPLVLAVTSYWSALTFVLLLALAESIWAPRLYDYSTMVAPEGFEGTFVAITFVPQYVAAGVVGVSSGYLLDHFVPPTLNLDGNTDGTDRRPDLLWGTVAATSFISPVLIVLGRKFLFSDDSASGDSDADRELEPVVYKSSGTSPTKGEYSRVDRSFDDESADPTAEGFA